MKLAIITDSTSDLQAAELERLDVRRVPLYVTFRGQTVRDWLDIGPADIVAGVAAGAELPTTSQPSPEDFAEVYRQELRSGADAILVITLSTDVSGTYQSATLAAESVDADVRVFDSRVACLGHGAMARTASRLRAAGASLDDILEAMAHIRDNTFIAFTVATLEYLQKGGRIGRAGALVGSLLNIKPILTMEEGRVAPLTRARGMKRALQEMVSRFEAFAAAHPDEHLTLDYIHVQDADAIDGLRRAVEASGVRVEVTGTYEIGAVIASHVGQGTFGMIARAETR